MNRIYYLQCNTESSLTGKAECESEDSGKTGARGLLRPPGEETGEHVKQLSRHLETLCPPAAEAVDRMEAAGQAGEGFEELTIDHARLFVGPFALLAPPYGSVYLEGERRLMGDSTLAAGECYNEVGLELAAATRIFIESEFDQCRSETPVLTGGLASA